MQYCGAEHQKAHRPEHKTSCNMIKKAREAYEREKAALEAHPGDMMMPANPFETVRGKFWYVLDTRPYSKCLIYLCGRFLLFETSGLP